MVVSVLVVLAVMVVVMVVRDGPEGTIYHFLDYPGSDLIPFWGESPINNQIRCPL